MQTHREIVKSQSQLQTDITEVPEFIADNVPLQNVGKGSPEYLGDTNILGQYIV